MVLPFSLVQNGKTGQIYRTSIILGQRRAKQGRILSLREFWAKNGRILGLPRILGKAEIGFCNSGQKPMSAQNSGQLVIDCVCRGRYVGRVL
jgi:hypothetical protein